MRDALLIVFIFLSGCATYRAQPIAPAQLAQRFETRSLASGELHEWFARELGHGVGPWPPARWSRQSLTLAAWYYNPALDVARAQWGTARAGIEVADAIPNPVLQLPFEYTIPNPGPGAPFTTGPSLDIPIETAGKRGYRVDQASHQSESARLNIANEAWKVSAQVRDAMLALYAARERVSWLSPKMDAMQQIVAMVRKRRAVGENAGPDVDAALAAATQAQADLASARIAQQEAQAQLATAIGVPEAALDDIAIDFDAVATVPPAPPDADARRNAMFDRADLRASLADYAAAESALQLEVAKQYPDIHLGSGYTYDTGTNRIAFGLAGITLPVFDRNHGGIAQAAAKRKEAAARTAALQDAILGDVDRGVARYRSSLDALPIAEANLAAARRQRDSEAAGFAAGDVDRVTCTQAKADYASSEIGHLDAVIAARQAADALEDAMQRPLPEDDALNTARSAQEWRK
ncbi:TolC family protein [Paraburkholderia rhizosphaerae]|uniref:Outer membrane protein TolC n=1 Tax=Paraburkholderia rhizosphaerae TaxID=480658 RepID=A0A4R8LC50_9BURK|nr:TolC family protein [Paraburkholderia rhizosphaerae]TDY40542.1 outer membrane protein TolC [Paraburkholderia rhizosphaerae]